MSSSEKVISSLSYLSICCAPFLVAAIIYMTTGDHEVRAHARKALLSHLIPLVSLALLSISFFEFGQIFNSVTITCIIIFGSIAIAGIIWNVKKGITILTKL